MTAMFELVPQNDLHWDGNAWIATGDDPHFLLRPGAGQHPTGWNLLRFKLETEAGKFSSTLYVDDGNGLSKPLAWQVSAEEAGGGGMLLYLPGTVRALRLDPISGHGRFRIDGVRIEQVGRARAVLLHMSRVVSRIVREPAMARRYVTAAVQITRRSGLRGVLRHVLRKRQPSNELSNKSYVDWIRAYDSLNADDRAAISVRIATIGERPIISVIMPLYDVPEYLLRRSIDSVRAQLWPHWELCLADDASTAPHVRAVCEEYVRRDKRIRFAQRNENGDIAAASNTALGLATGEFVALLDQADEFAVHSLYMVAEALADRPDLDLIFSDEDKIGENDTRRDPWFKSDWNYDLMLSQNAVSHLAVFRRSLVEAVGGFRGGFDGSHDYDLTLRVAERTTPDRICHIPFVLYHCRAIPNSVTLDVGKEEYPYDAALRALQEHLDRSGLAGARAENQSHPGHYRVRWPLPSEPVRVAIIIPTRDKVEFLSVCVDSVLERTEYAKVEIVVVDNGSIETETQQYLREIQDRHGVRVLRYDHPYNFAALNNWAVTQTDAPLVAFLNNDVEVITPGWLSEMAAQALRPEVGAIGCKLYYPDGTIQHAGIFVGIGGTAGHLHLGLPPKSLGYFGRAACAQRLSAVTAACMMMRREVFVRVGGFNNRDFAIAFNDVDLGLRLNRAGLAVVWTPHAELFHHESASLGLPTDNRRRRQFEIECANLCHSWPVAIENDPFYNPNLTIAGVDWSLAFPPRVTRPWKKFRP
jgi:GT2 family glycosyltransferase